jgi:hypothetical protein
MIGQLAEWYNSARSTSNVQFLGRMLHTIQDSFSQSHTMRNGNFEIEHFFNYNNQDPDKHALSDRGNWNNLPGTSEAVLSSIGVLRSYLNGDSTQQVMDYLRGVFKLAPGTENQTAGGI